MKDLIVSAVAVSVLIAAWLLFSGYSEKQIDDFTSSVETVILPAVESENWAEGIENMTGLSDRWQSYKKTAVFFIDTNAISEIDYSMAKSLKYVQARDLSNSSGELLAMLRQLNYLSTNEKVSLANIL